ncbi:MAG: hypothetical protein ACHQAX_07825 [Gammaproteobacteria bacterium]
MTLQELENHFKVIAHADGMSGGESSPESAREIIDLLTEENIPLLNNKTGNPVLIVMALFACYLLDSKDKFQKICELQNVRNQLLFTYTLRNKIISNNRADFLKVLMKIDRQEVPGASAYVSHLKLALTSNATEVFNVLMEDNAFQQHLEIYRRNLHAPLLRTAVEMGNIDALKRLLESNAVLAEVFPVTKNGGSYGGVDPREYSMKANVVEAIKSAKMNAYTKIVRFSESTEHPTISECKIVSRMFNGLCEQTLLDRMESISIVQATELGRKIATKLLANRIRLLCEKLEKSDNLVFCPHGYWVPRDFDDILSADTLFKNDIESMFLPEISYPRLLSASFINESKLKVYLAMFNCQAHTLYAYINGIDIKNVDFIGFKHDISIRISNMGSNKPSPYISERSKNDGKILVYAAFFSKQLSFIKLPGQEDVSGKLKQLKSDVDKLFSETPACESSYLLKSVREEVAEECRRQRFKSGSASMTAKVLK